MKKYILLLMTIMVLLIVGCSISLIKASNIAKINSIEITRYKYTSGGAMMKSEIAKTWTLLDKDTIANFVKALNDRVKTEGKLDIRPRDYSVKIIYTDKSIEEYDLWVDEDENVRGVLMQGNDIWFISTKSNEIFKNVLK